ncbi:hypothetical protein [Paraburkholderia terrae]
MGLGLTSALAVIRAHGGDIKLANRQGNGLEVCVTLPVASMISGNRQTSKA